MGSCPALFVGTKQEGKTDMSKITDTVWQLAEPIVRENGCEIWDVEYVREAGTWFLRIYIDREDGVSINHCEAISRTLDPILDEKDPIPGSYTFEVSSAGADRPLKRESDFIRFMGSTVEVKLYKPKNGRKEYKGTLKSYDNGSVTVEVEAETVEFTKAEVANVRLYPEF